MELHELFIDALYGERGTRRSLGDDGLEEILVLEPEPLDVSGELPVGPYLLDLVDLEFLEVLAVHEDRSLEGISLHFFIQGVGVVEDDLSGYRHGCRGMVLDDGPVPEQIGLGIDGVYFFQGDARGWCGPEFDGPRGVSDDHGALGG
jgi:hypothetical protein